MVEAATAPGRTRDERRSHTNWLLAKAHGSDSEERQRLLDEAIQENIPVATSIARRYRGRGIAVEDLEQVACLALVRAAQRYDPDKAEDFLTFAVPTIRGEVKRYFRDHGWMVRPTRAVQEAQSLINQEGRQADGCERTPAELSAELGIPRAVVDAALQAQGCFSPVSIDQPLEGGDVASDRLVAGDAGAEFDAAEFDAAEARAMLSTLTRHLKPRDRLILYLRFVEGLTQAEIGEEMGVTQMQVSRLLARVLSRLRELGGSDDLG